MLLCVIYFCLKMCCVVWIWLPYLYGGSRMIPIWLNWLPFLYGVASCYNIQCNKSLQHSELAAIPIRCSQLLQYTV